MRALTASHYARDTRRDRATADELDVDRSRTLLQVAVNLVFGTPFLWALLVAVRGRTLWQSHRIFGDALGHAATSMWIMVAATGALWLGVSLMLASAPRAKAAGGIAALVACALLLWLRL
jgi:uncharacterized membrane protein